MAPESSLHAMIVAGPRRAWKGHEEPLAFYSYSACRSGPDPQLQSGRCRTRLKMPRGMQASPDLAHIRHAGM